MSFPQARLKTWNPPFLSSVTSFQGCPSGLKVVWVALKVCCSLTCRYWVAIERTSPNRGACGSRQKSAKFLLARTIHLNLLFIRLQMMPLPASADIDTSVLELIYPPSWSVRGCQALIPVEVSVPGLPWWSNVSNKQKRRWFAKSTLRIQGRWCFWWCLCMKAQLVLD